MYLLNVHYLKFPQLRMTSMLLGDRKDAALDAFKST